MRLRIDRELPPRFIVGLGLKDKQMFAELRAVVLKVPVRIYVSEGLPEEILGAEDLQVFDGGFFLAVILLNLKAHHRISISFSKII
jgi:hypothetical protein